MRIGSAGRVLRRRWQTSTPSSFGNRRSSRTRSKLDSAPSLAAVRPSPATSTVWPAPLSKSTSPSRKLGSSSTIRIFIGPLSVLRRRLATSKSFVKGNVLNWRHEAAHRQHELGVGARRHYRVGGGRARERGEQTSRSRRRCSRGDFAQGRGGHPTGIRRNHRSEERRV